MDNEKVARKLLFIAKSFLADFNSEGLNGMSNREAKKFVNNLLGRYTKGFFRDEYWRPVNKTLEELRKHGIHPIVNSEYRTSRFMSMPDSKIWNLKIEFVNNKGRETTIYGVIVASGAGTTDDPLSVYDLVAYVS